MNFYLHSNRIGIAQITFETNALIIKIHKIHRLSSCYYFHFKQLNVLCNFVPLCLVMYWCITLNVFKLKR
jgi:hypothetical protein